MTTPCVRGSAKAKELLKSCIFPFYQGHTQCGKLSSDRAYRLYVVFQLNVEQLGGDGAYKSAALSRHNLELMRSVREVHLLTFLLMLSIPFIIIVAFFLIWDQLDAYFPYSEITSCFLSQFESLDSEGILKSQARAINVSILIALGIIFVEHMLFGVTIFKLRHISDQFSITQQFKFVYIAWGLSGFCAIMLVVFVPLDIKITWSLYTYFYYLRNVILFSVSVVSPIRKSFHPSYQIPLESKYCAQDFKIASSTHLPTLYFNNFLKDRFPETGLLMFQMFMDIRIYQNLANQFVMTDQDSSSEMVFELSHQRKDPKSEALLDYRDKAVEIFSIYLASDAPFHVRVTPQILHTLDKLVFSSRENITESLFDELMDEISDKLEDYYSQFKKDQKYKQLIRELEMREIQHSLLMRLRMLPSH